MTSAEATPNSPPRPPIRIRMADLAQRRDAEALLSLLDAYARDPMGEGRPLTAETRACLIPALRRVPNALVFLAWSPVVSELASASASASTLASAAEADAPAQRGGSEASAHRSQAVGAAVCFVGFSTFRARGLINVHDLAVLPDWRGYGIGGRLLGAVEGLARRRGYCKVTLEVRLDNPAQRLYRRSGYGAAALGESGDDASIQYAFLEKRLDD
jgi:ribosomal protein S18 acetylase RimI-like enzyme